MGAVAASAIEDRSPAGHSPWEHFAHDVLVGHLREPGSADSIKHGRGAAAGTTAEAAHDSDPFTRRSWWPVAPTVVEVEGSLAESPGLQSVWEALSATGLAPGLVSSLTDIVGACVSVTVKDPVEPANAPSNAPGHHDAPTLQERAQGFLSAVGTLAGATAQLEAVLLDATTALTAANGALLLADKGAASSEELTSGQLKKWRGEAKKVTRAEIGAATGWGVGEVSDLVALANTPHTVTTPARRAMSGGDASWRLVRRFHRACSQMDTEDAAAISNALFGEDPVDSVTERLDSAGRFTPEPWAHREFYRALDREVAKVKARDPDNARKTREQGLAEGDVRIQLDDGGTATLTIGCAPVQGAAIIDRISKAAKAARAAGDPRTLRQLRVAVAAALLLHGTLTMGDLPEDPDLITVEQSAQLTKILHALPTAELNVIVPLTTLLGTTPNGLTLTTNGTGPVDAEGKPIPAAFAAPDTDTASTGRSDANRPGGSMRDPEQPGTGCICPCTCGAAPASRPPGRPSDRGAPVDPGDMPGEIGVGEIIGAHSMFLSPDQVRELALTPGSTLHRLVTDPVTGTLIERSIKAYPFDTAMRAHIIAADVFCRFPGCPRPASLSQIDHVQEHGTLEGHTCIGNGQAAHEAHHDLKTNKYWDAVIDTNRDVTWTSLLGRIYRTKAHDYRQYTKLLTAAITQVDTAIREGTARDAAIDQAIYQALSHRPPGAPLEAEDDWDTEEFTGWHQITLTHTNPATGRRRYHPAPDTAKNEATRFQETRGQAESDHSTGIRSKASEDRGADSGGDSGDGSGPDCEATRAAENDNGADNDHGTNGAGNTASATDQPGSKSPWADEYEGPPPF